MKKFTSLVLASIVALGLASCTGPAGRDGFDGFDGRDGINGIDGVNVKAAIFEVEVDFNAENEYSNVYEFPLTTEVFETDVVLVYLLWDQTTDSNGDAVDIWRLVPQTRLLDQGILQYNYDHTFLDVRLFLEGDFDLSTLPVADTQDQLFRIAVVPATFGVDNSIDLTNMSNVMQALNIQENSISRHHLN